MSGEAGAELTSRYYSIFLGTGVSEDLALPPDDDGSYLDTYFAERSAPYERWLESARADLDALFDRLAQQLPLLPVATAADSIDGAIIGGRTPEQEQVAADHFRRHWRGQPVAVQVTSYDKLDGSLRLSLVASGRIALDQALDEVAKVLAAHGQKLPELS